MAGSGQQFAAKARGQAFWGGVLVPACSIVIKLHWLMADQSAATLLASAVDVHRPGMFFFQMASLLT